MPPLNEGGLIDQADARVVRYPPRSGWSWEIKLKGVDWPTLQSFSAR